MAGDYPFDAEPGEDEVEYNRRKEAEAKTSTDFFFTLIRLAFIAIRYGIIYCFFLYAAVLLSRYFWEEETEWWKIAGLTLVLTYLMLCVVYFAKGIMLGLRAKKNGWWKVLWALCVLVTCVPPIVVTNVLVLSFFSFQSQQLLSTRLIAWGIGLAAGFYTYSIYQFLSPVAPRLLYWSFAAGLRLPKKK